MIWQRFVFGGGSLKSLKKFFSYLLVRWQDLNLRSPDYEPGEMTVSLQRKRVNPAAGSPTATLLRLRSSYQTNLGHQGHVGTFCGTMDLVNYFDPQNINNPQRLPFHSASRA